MKLKLTRFLVLVFALISQLALSQEKNASGVVTDVSGLPLPGVNVVIKGTNKGTQTDFDGKFKIQAEQGQILVFSYLGMTNTERPASANMNVKLQDDSVKLTDVVVTAFGIKRDKKSLGYSSQQVTAEQVNSVPTTNFVNNLAGKVAGLDIKQGTNFGGSTNVVLRGFKSIKGDNQALFVVDGVPILNNNINSTDQVSGRGGYDYGNAASDINPNDIAEINVLKGAAATALYGSRAQNGAIIITTKKGKLNSDLSLEFSSAITTSTIDKTTFPTYQKEYGEGYYGENSFGSYLGDNAVAYGDDASYGPKYDNSQVWQYGAFIPGSSSYGQKTAWRAADNGPITFFHTAISTVNNLSLSAGTDKATFRFNYGNTNSDDILPNSYLNKNNFTGNSSYKFNDKLTANFSVNYTTQYTKGRNSTGYNDNIMSNFRQWWPTNVDLKEQQQLYELSNQNYTWNITSESNLKPQYWNNPYFQRYQSFSSDVRKRLAANASLSYDVSKSINLLARVGTDGYTLNVQERLATGSVAGTFGLNTVSQPSGYSVSNYDINEQNYDFLATFKRNLTEDLNLNLIIGTNYNTRNFYSNRQSTAGGLYIPGLFTISNSLSAPPLPVITETRKDIFGVFGQASLGWKNIYYLDGTYRKDKSSALPSNNNTYDYYSGTASLVFTNWDFLKDNNFLTFGKLRAAYAQVGSDTDPNQLSNVYFPGTPFTSAIYSYNTNAKNPNLKPQRLDNKEFGGNLQFAKNRVGIDVSWFENKAFDQILALPVSLGTGVLNQVKNAGTLQTRGFEISLNATPIKTENFSWDVNVNWSNPRTKVVELSAGVENIRINTSSLQGGISINAPLNKDYGTIWGTDFLYAPDGQKIIGADGAYRVSTTVNNDLGSFQADWAGGINNKFTYKNVSFSFLIDGKKGGKIFSLDQYYGYGTGLYPDSVGNNDLGNPIRNDLTAGADSGGVILNGVMEDPANPGQYLQNNVRLDKSQSSQVLGTDPPTAAFVYDATFAKLREVQFSYDLPNKFLKNSLLKKATFSLIGNNVWIISKKLPYSDPEAGLSSGNVQGYQSGPKPTTRNISFNVKITF
jgi:TonB-linked SusC/RagA family outer membrane protein